MSERPKLSRREAYRLALHHAITDREGMAEAWDRGSPESQDAAWLASEFKRVLAEAFGERTFEDAMAASSAKAVPLQNLMTPETLEFRGPVLSLKIPSPVTGKAE